MSEKDIQKLIKAGIIDQHTADKITAYFEHEKEGSGNIILTLFASIGALLLGGGILLILAHNWDRMPESARVGVALLPLIITQISGGYALFKKPDSLSWREAAGVLNFLAIGATMATLGQIYHLTADVTSFLKIWILTGIPILYLLRSHTTGLLILIWIFLYIINDKNPGEIRYWPWVFILLAFPFYFKSYQEHAKSRIQFAYNWLGCLLFIIIYAVTYSKAEFIIFLILAVLTGFYFAVSKFTSEEYQTHAHNSWHHLSQAGTLILCYIFAFKDFWKHYKMQEMPWHFWIFLSIPVLFVLYQIFTKPSSIKDFIQPPYHFWAIVLVFHFLNPGSFILFALFNVLLLLYGIYFMYQGIKSNGLYQTNLGLLSIVFIITTRFFDIDMSFMLRGIVFIIMGASFFAVNYFLIKTRKS